MKRTLFGILSLFLVGLIVRSVAAEDKDFGSDACCSYRTWDVGYEHAILKPHFEQVTTGNDSNFKGIYHDRTLTFDWDLQYNPRFWFGQTNCDGMGWRVTYFGFDHHADLSVTEGVGGWNSIDVQWDREDEDILS